MTSKPCALDPSAATLASLWLTLARAFLPPLEAEHWRAMHAALPLDLAEWRHELGLGHTPRAEELLAAQAAYNEHDALLLHYSELFLAPRSRVKLEVGHYLDGATMAQDTLNRWHLAYGLDHSADYHDCSDHLAAMLEFLGEVAGLDEPQLAAEYTRVFLLPALPRQIQAMRREGVGNSPYLWLMRFTLSALEQLYGPPTADPEIPAMAAAPRAACSPWDS